MTWRFGFFFLACSGKLSQNTVFADVLNTVTWNLSMKNTYLFVTMQTGTRYKYSLQTVDPSACIQCNTVLTALKTASQLSQKWVCSDLCRTDLRRGPFMLQTYYWEVTILLDTAALLQSYHGGELLPTQTKIRNC